MSPLRAGNYAQISARLLLSTSAPGSAYVAEGRVLDIEKTTVAPVLQYEHNGGLIRFQSGRHVPGAYSGHSFTGTAFQMARPLGRPASGRTGVPRWR